MRKFREAIVIPSTCVDTTFNVSLCPYCLERISSTSSIFVGTLVIVSTWHLTDLKLRNNFAPYIVKEKHNPQSKIAIIEAILCY